MNAFFASGGRLRRPTAAFCAVLALALSGAGANPPSPGEEYVGAGLSKTMQAGIRAYDQGKDSEAMDHFMEVLSSGEPSERAMANDYLNLITQRMYSGASIHPPIVGQKPLAPPTVARPAPPKARLEPSQDRREVMKREIELKIREQVRRFLAELENHPEIRIVMADSQNPRALGIPTSLFFDKDIRFKKTALAMLKSLTGLVYNLGGTQVSILPEGLSTGETKILDMRRTMGISSHLTVSGISPARVRVNLLLSQVDLPKALADFRGIIVLFTYNQPLTLSTDAVTFDESGPPISLGVWPERFRGDRGEGAIIEFSIQEPPAGLMSWKFQLRQSAGAAGGLRPLQEVVGTAPVFHQIFWNGKKSYFGQDLAPGRYEAVLSATDARNRTRTLHRWISLEGASVVSVSTQPAKPPPAVKAAPRRLYDAQINLPAVRGQRKAKNIATKPRPGFVKTVLPRAAPTAAVAGSSDSTPAAPAAATIGTVSYKIAFAKGTQQMSAEGDQTVTRLAEVLERYPREGLELVGYAGSSETGASELARNRAEMVSALLVNKYGVDPKRIEIQSKVAEGENYEVQVFIVAARE